MPATELREALEALDQLLGAFAEWVSDEQNDEARDWALVKLAPFASRAETIRDAARTIALPILEADPELVERIRWCRKHSCSAVPGYEYCYASPTVFPTVEAELHRCQIVVLAALITTDGEKGP